MREYCCKQMETALTAGRKEARQLEINENGVITIFTYATDQEPYHEVKVIIEYCPFCGYQLYKPAPISAQDWKEIYKANR